jgi:3-methyladenine DNA glycosylase AlkC
MAEPFKNMFSPEYVLRLAERVEQVYPHIDTNPIRDLEHDGTLTLEMKGRASAIAERLRDCLGAPAPDVFEHVVELTTTGERWSGFDIWPHTMVVEQLGVAHPHEALDALYVLTQHFTAEFAIRPLLLNHQELVLERLRSWLDDNSEHVRRLISEGTRPYLPWGQRLNAIVDDPSLTLGLLEVLRDDPSEYVRRSVANHLNDLSKTAPDLVVETCRRWLNEQATEPVNRQRMVRHALRTLIKRGHTNALSLLGAGPASVRNVRVRVDPGSIKLGESFELLVDAEATGNVPEKWVVDFAIHFVKANGSTAPKVFKGTTLNEQTAGPWHWSKKVSVKPISTRRYYEGTHVVEVMINGKSVGNDEFELVMP